MSGLNYCFTALPDHNRVQCGAFKRGGIDAIAIIDSDANITNYSSASQWQAAIDAENVKIIKGVKAEIPVGSAVTGENPIGCGAENVIDGFDYVLNINDFNVLADNDAFWATVNGNQYYIAVRLCNEEELLIVELPVTIQASQASVPMSNKEKQKYEVVFSWSADKDWYYERVTQPAGIFD